MLWTLRYLAAAFVGALIVAGGLFFEKVREKDKRGAKKWLRASVLLAAGLMIVLIASLPYRE